MGTYTCLKVGGFFSIGKSGIGSMISMLARIVHVGVEDVQIVRCKLIAGECLEEPSPCIRRSYCYGFC